MKLTDADFKQTPFMRGRREFILIKGKRRVTRSYQPNLNEWGSYTEVGRAFYKKPNVRMIVQVPTLHVGTRSSGQPYSRNHTFPLREPVEIPFGLSPEQRDDRVKREVIRKYAGKIIASYSDEQITLRPDGTEWSIMEMVTTPAEGNALPQTEVVERAL